MIQNICAKNLTIVTSAKVVLCECAYRATFDGLSPFAAGEVNVRIRRLFIRIRVVAGAVCGVDAVVADGPKGLFRTSREASRQACKTPCSGFTCPFHLWNTHGDINNSFCHHKGDTLVLACKFVVYSYDFLCA